MARKRVGLSANDSSQIVTLGEIIRTVNVSTGSEARPATSNIVMWIGGSTKPVNMINGDLWLSPVSTPSATAPDITTTSLNALVVGTSFSQSLAASGSSPISWSVSSGTLPSGLSLNTSTGTISGTPSAAGSYSFSITASNSAGSDVQAFSGSVTASGTAPTITTTSLPTITQNAAYDSGALVATGSTPITWGVTGGTLPNGLAISSSTGAISGTATVSGAYSFTVTATNSFGSATQTFTGTIASSATEYTIFAGATPSGTYTTYTDGTVNSWYQQQFYITSSPARNWKIKGMRMYVPAGSAAIGRTGFIGIQRRPAASGGIIKIGDNPFWASSFADSKTQMSAPIVAGWNTFLFSQPWDFNSLDGMMVAYSFSDWTGYIHSNRSTSIGANVLQSSSGVNLYLAEEGDGSGGDTISARYDGARAINAYYGIDVIVSTS